MTITELAGATGVSKHTLRYYERVGLVPLVERDPSSRHRRYSDGHVRWIGFLRQRVVATINALQRRRALLDRKLRAGCAPGDLKPRTQLGALGGTGSDT